MLTYLRIGSGRDRKCVSTVLNVIDGFHPEKSPIFCGFSQRADDNVVEYFKLISFLPVPVYYMHMKPVGHNDRIGKVLAGDLPIGLGQIHDNHPHLLLARQALQKAVQAGLGAPSTTSNNLWFFRLTSVVA